MKRLTVTGSHWIKHAIASSGCLAQHAPAAAATLGAPQLQQAAIQAPLPSHSWRTRIRSHYSTSTSATTSTTTSANGAEARPAAATGSTSAGHEQRNCWSCQAPIERGALICTACDAIQPMDPSLTHYELLGYDNPAFDLDPSELEKSYKLLQWQLHPDKAALREPAEQEHSADHASLLNQAYSALRSPLARANYLLKLHGIASGDSHEGTIEDPELLMEVMEAREEVESTHDKERLRELQATNRQQQAALEQRLSQAFAAQDLQAAAALTTELTYLDRLEQAIHHKL